MNFPEYKKLVSKLRIGKKLPTAIYIHSSNLPALPIQLSSLIIDTCDKFKISDKHWNVIKLYLRDFKIVYLNYPHFEDNSYPSLHTSQIIDLQNNTSRVSDYSKSDNPPILHRKETFVPKDYPLRKQFEDITNEGVAIGLYENTKRIGFKQNWERLIKSKGYL